MFFINPKNDVKHWKQKMLWQHFTTMVIDKIRKITVKGVTLKSKSFFLISLGVLELWRKTLGGPIPSPPLPPTRIGLRQSALGTTCNYQKSLLNSAGGCCMPPLGPGKIPGGVSGAKLPEAQTVLRFTWT